MLVGQPHKSRSLKHSLGIVVCVKVSIRLTPDSILGVWLYIKALYSMDRGHEEESVMPGQCTAVCNIIVLDIIEMVIMDLSATLL